MANHGSIIGIEYYLPKRFVTTEDLCASFPGSSFEKVDAKTGIQKRHIADANECASDLAFAAAQKLFKSGLCRPDQIDFVLLCTQTPDYFLPTTACLLQDRLGIPTSAGALDFNLGSSGFVYGLGLAEGLITSQQASHVLLITADTYSKIMNPADKSVRAVFGDAATVTLIIGRPSSSPFIGPFEYGTDGSGAPNLIIPAGGARTPRTPATAVEIEDKCGNRRSADNLYMDGPRIFDFILTIAPRTVDAMLKKARISHAEVGLFVFHQANAYALEQLRRTIGIPREKFQVTIGHCGNTSSSTIPIALKHAAKENRLCNGTLVMIVGFGVGYSWGATLIRWSTIVG